MTRALEHTPELKAKQAEFQARFNDLMTEIEKYPLQLVWMMDPDDMEKLRKTVALIQSCGHDSKAGLYVHKEIYKVVLRGMGEAELEDRKTKNL